MIGHNVQAAADAAGNISIAPDVLVRLIDRALTAVPGIVRPGTIPPRRANAATAVAPGVALAIGSNGVHVDCYLVARAGTSLIEVGCAVQFAVAGVVAAQTGMPVAEVHVLFEDVVGDTQAKGIHAHG